MDAHDHLLRSFDVQMANSLLDKLGDQVHYYNYYDESWTGAERPADQAIVRYSLMSAVISMDDKQNTFIAYTSYALNKADQLIRIESDLVCLDLKGNVVFVKRAIPDAVFDAAVTQNGDYLGILYGDHRMENAVQAPFTYEIWQRKGDRKILSESFEANETLLGIEEVLPGFFQVTADPFKGRREDIFLDFNRRILYRGNLDKIDISKFHSWNTEGITLDTNGKTRFYPFSSFLTKQNF